MLLDTKGPEIRSGFFADGAKSISLEKGQSLILTTDYTFKGGANGKKLACSYPSLCKYVKIGQKVLVADGSLVRTVSSIDEAAGLLRNYNRHYQVFMQTPTTPTWIH